MSGSDLFTGTLDILVLRTVQDEPHHGYAIVQALREMSGGVLDIAEGVMYPALHRLEERGLLEADWGPSKTGRRAKYYTLTSSGRRHLADQCAGWTEFTTAVSAVLRTTRVGGPAAAVDRADAVDDPKVTARPA